MCIRDRPKAPQAVTDYFVWKIGSEVSPGAEAQLRNAVSSMYDFAVFLGISQSDQPLTIFFYRSFDALAAEFKATAGRGLSDDEYAVIQLPATQAGSEAVVTYYASLWPASVWEETFQPVLGMTVEQFYQLAGSTAPLLILD